MMKKILSWRVTTIVNIIKEGKEENILQEGIEEEEEEEEVETTIIVILIL